MTAQTYTVDNSAAALQKEGQALVSALYVTLQALKLFPLENETVQKALDELDQGTRRLLDREGTVELTLVGDFVFINDVRIRLNLSTYAAVSLVSSSLDRHRIGALTIEPGTERSEWPPFLSLLLRQPASEHPFTSFVKQLDATPVQHLFVGPEQARTTLIEDDPEGKEQSKRVYFQSVEAAKSVLNDIRLGKSVNARGVRRAIQSIVDQVLNNETSIMGMTALRDYDDYTFIHCVNVCIFAVVLGQKLGLNKLQLYELGLGALLHDLGKMKIDEAITKKTSGLTDEEFKKMQQHTTEGLLTLFDFQGLNEPPFRTMLMAYEHHMKRDLTGYPRNKRARKPTLFSRIVAVADGFDAATSHRSYQEVPWRPEDALIEMRDNPRRGYDPLLVKALINVTGIYPPGTLVILDTHEMAVVTKPNPNPDRLNEPVVKIIYSSSGMPISNPMTVTIGVGDPETGQPARNIIKTTRPEKYGISLDAYFV